MSSDKATKNYLGPNRFAFGGGTKPLSELMFNKYDTDKNGTISCDEFRSLCYDMGHFLSDAELAWAWTIVDKDGSGLIEYREFIEWWKNSSRFEHLKILDDQQAMLICRITELFRPYDVNSQGTIDKEQFQQLCQDFSREGIFDVDAHRASQFEEIDRSGDQRIHFNELIAWLKNISVLK